VYPCVSTEDPEEQKCYFLYYYIKEIYNIKKSSGSSGTSRTYTHLNQNTGEDFLEKVFRFCASVFRVFRNTSSK
jgi:restriction endonuclease S subunit